MSDEIIQIRKYLADIPELLAEASHYLTPGSAPVDPTSTRGATIFRIPIVPAIFDLLDERDKDVEDVADNRINGERRLGVLRTLGLWVSLAYAELDDLGREPRECCEHRAHTILGECTWLAEYTGEILELHPDFHQEVERLWTELRTACRIRKPYIPKCNVCGWRVEPVYAENDPDAPAWWRCTGCPKTWVKDAEVRRLALTQPPMALRQMATFLGLPFDQLKQWESDNRFMPVGSKGGVALYEVEHVRAANERDGQLSDLQPGKVVAAKVGIPWSTLRFWEQKGRVSAAKKDRSGQKLFSIEAVKKLVKSAPESGIAS